MARSPKSALDRFSPATAAWFEGAFEAPTAAQEGAWRALGEEKDVLVVAPTGSGKTLAAFLSALDSLAAAPPPEEPKRRCRVLYISPLKALGVDVERNLAVPLQGIRAEAARLGLPEPEIRVAVRSGDTPQSERRSIAVRPPDILITTPESLFLMLTSKAREALAGVETVILDEVHAVAGTKRGAHLALSLERLDELLERPARRIGLSATVRPVEEVARFLSPQRNVEVVQPPSSKVFDLSVVVPVEDMGDLAAAPAPGATPAAEARAAGSIWPHVEERITDLVEAHRSTIVFTNARRVAERLSSRLNEIEHERMTGRALPEDHGPAEMMGGASATPGAPQVLARTHHGSISKEQRKLVEEDLKSGRLRAVVATSSLELGIDMGAVDLVVQVEAPPSVASGLQRVGRAGHQVGAVSRGVFFPKTRGDLVQSAVVAERMREGAIEALKIPANPLDVLAQQLVAMCAMDDWTTADLLAVVRRSAPFASLPESAFEATLDMLAGRYPSDAFAELRPRLVWDRASGNLTARPGAQRLAVTSGGTIPDRGLFGVFLAGTDPKRGGGRVGELDEEMVYESRVGDVFSLGTSSWRIEEVTRDRVVVSPAPGVPGRLPFWIGDNLGRPLELGRALGAFTREIASLPVDSAHKRLNTAGLDDFAARNALAYLDEQREATRHVPDDRTIVVERFRDELGDWRIVVHSPFGARVHAPWALALGARLRERHGVDPQLMHHDDGLVLRLPDTDDFGFDPADLAFDKGEITDLVTEAVSGSALFSSRFREAAARALLLPHRQPGKRQPLWQQRLRSSQLLEVAAEFPSFPIILEAVREVLQDVYDVPGLAELMGDIEARRVRLVEVATPEASPFARSLLFGYVAQFMYQGDTPLAERRAAALSLDSRLLGELLGQAELRELLDLDALESLERELQWLTEDRRARDAESVADLLRLLGPLRDDELAERGAEPAWAAALAEAGRAVRVSIAGRDHWAAVEDAGRLHDALGTVLPDGVPDAFLEPVADPLGDLLARYARTHGPFTSGDAAARFGLGTAVTDGVLHRLAADGRLTGGEFRPGGEGREWCDATVLRRLRRRSLAALRKELEPVAPVAFAAFLPEWQHVGGGLSGVDGLARAAEQLQGVPVPASALEKLILPARVADYVPVLLDELTASGEILWAGAGAIPGKDGWIALYPAETAPLYLPDPQPFEASPLHNALLDALAGGFGLFFRQLAEQARAEHPEALESQLAEALWDLVWAGRITNDTLAPLRAYLGSGSAPGATAHRAKRAAPRGRYSPGVGSGWRELRAGTGIAVMPTVAGRWSLLPEPAADPTVRAHALATTLLDRHGVVTRGAVAAEDVEGGFAKAYRVLSVFEESGKARRGYVVEGLGAAQFAADGAVDRLRAVATDRERPGRDSGPTDPVVLAATDPANAYGAALPWPEPPAGAGHKPGRKAGSLVVLVDGDLALYLERGGKTLIAWPATETDDWTADQRLRTAVDALAESVRGGAAGVLSIERVNDAAALSTPLGPLLEAAGFRATHKAYRLRP